MSIEEIFSKQNGVTHHTEPINDCLQKGFSAKFTIVGYVKDTRYLIAMLDSSSRITGDLIKSGVNHIVENFDSTRKYIYVNVRALGIDPKRTKVKRKKKEKVSKISIDSIELSF